MDSVFISRLFTSLGLHCQFCVKYIVFYDFRIRNHEGVKFRYITWCVVDVSLSLFHFLCLFPLSLSLFLSLHCFCITFSLSLSLSLYFSALFPSFHVPLSLLLSLSLILAIFFNRVTECNRRAIGEEE